MRILHVVPTYLPAHRYGGPIYSVHGLCKALAARGHEVHVFTTNVDGPGDSDVPLGEPVLLDGVKVWYFPSRRLRRLYWSPPMARALAEFLPGCEVLHLHSVFLWPTWAAARVARRHGVPYVLAPRGMLVPELIQRKSRWLKRAWIALIERRNIQSAALIHLTSPSEERELARFGFQLPALAEIPNGIETPPAAPAMAGVSSRLQALKGQGPMVLFLSRVHWKKGVDRLIEALAQLPGVQLVVAGNDEEGYLPTLQALATRLQLGDRVHFVGPVQGADKEFLLRQADLLVLPSSYTENFGNVVLEAMIRDCPVVVSEQVGLADWLRSSDAGAVCEATPDVLANTLRVCLADVPGTRARAVRASELAQGFLWSRVAADMELAYEPLVNAALPSPSANEHASR